MTIPRDSRGPFHGGRERFGLPYVASRGENRGLGIGAAYARGARLGKSRAELPPRKFKHLVSQ
jgi:hypothetical protein